MTVGTKVASTELGVSIDKSKLQLPDRDWSQPIETDTEQPGDGLMLARYFRDFCQLNGVGLAFDLEHYQSRKRQLVISDNGMRLAEVTHRYIGSFYGMADDERDQSLIGQESFQVAVTLPDAAPSPDWLGVTIHHDPSRRTLNLHGDSILLTSSLVEVQQNGLLIAPVAADAAVSRDSAAASSAATILEEFRSLVS